MILCATRITAYARGYRRSSKGLRATGRFAWLSNGYKDTPERGVLVKFVYAALLAAAFGIAPAFADPPYVDTACGSWVNDQWVPNGNCAGDTRHDTVSGTITIVKGHLVTVQQATRTVVIDDQPALDAKQSGQVAVGRVIVAHGYWSNGNFYATAIY
jgi:hypothetical protein